jgi:hypothetical protein
MCVFRWYWCFTINPITVFRCNIMWDVEGSILFVMSCFIFLYHSKFYLFLLWYCYQRKHSYWQLLQCRRTGTLWRVSACFEQAVIDKSLFVSSMLWFLYCSEFKGPWGLEQWGKLLLLEQKHLWDQVNITSLDQHFVIWMESWKTLTMWFLLV